MSQILYSYISKSNHNLLLEQLPKFSENFYNRIIQYRRWQDIQLSILGRVLLMEGLKKFDIKFSKNEIKYNEFNKPYLSMNGIDFNISHSGNIAICILSKITQVGIDIERVEEIDVDDFKCQMTGLEWEIINSSENKKMSFFNYWTSKEAVMKACGQGFSLPLKNFEINNNKTRIEDQLYKIKNIKINNAYKCNFAYKVNDKVEELAIIPQLFNPLDLK